MRTKDQRFLLCGKPASFLSWPSEAPSKPQTAATAAWPCSGVAGPYESKEVLCG
jgi:hypothetical protein